MFLRVPVKGSFAGLLKATTALGFDFRASVIRIEFGGIQKNRGYKGILLHIPWLRASSEVFRV